MESKQGANHSIQRLTLHNDLCSAHSLLPTNCTVTHRPNRLWWTMQEDVIMFSDPHARLPIICDSVPEGVAVVNLSQSPYVPSYKGV